MSSTSSSRSVTRYPASLEACCVSLTFHSRREGRACAAPRRFGLSSATNTLRHPARTTPGSDAPTTVAGRCTMARCCASIRNRSSTSSPARISCGRPRPRRSLPSPALASTYHWSVSHGSTTALPRWACGTVWVCGSIFSKSRAERGEISRRAAMATVACAPRTGRARDRPYSCARLLRQVRLIDIRPSRQKC